MVKFAIGQDSHRFETDASKTYSKPLILGGVVFDGEPCLSANSDGDVILHALTNAISGITCKNILGKVADDMCKSGIIDSCEYLKVALKDLAETQAVISHVSFSVECKTPKMAPKLDRIRDSIGDMLGIASKCVGITATSGEGLTAFGRGEGIQVFCVITVCDRD